MLQFYLFVEVKYLTERKKKKTKEEEEGPVRFAFVWYKLTSQIKRVYGFAMDLPPDH